MEDWVPPRVASKRLGVCTKTLRVWADHGKIKYITTEGDQRRYLLSSVLPSDKHPKIGRRICYARVSTHGQRDDLQRQQQLLGDRFPDHELLADVGSGLNFKRRNFSAILDAALEGNIQELVVSHKDRLIRFGFELMEKIVQKGGGRILVLNQRNTSPQQELVADLISIVTCFSSRVYGLRSHSVKNAIRGAAQPEGHEVPPIPHGEGEGADAAHDGAVEVVL